MRRVPAATATFTPDGGVRLRSTRREFLGFPVHLPDPEVGANVHEALHRCPPLSRLGLESIVIEVTDGVVTLRGHVRSRVLRDRALACAESAPGVVNVRDRLLTDEELELEVARRFMSYPELQPSRIRVGCDRGVIRLEGELDSGDLVRLAVSVASHVPGVAGVDNRLEAGRPDVRRAAATRRPQPFPAGPIVVFLGPPGAGKSTWSRHVASRLGVPLVSAGAAVREAALLDARAAEAMEAGRLLPDAQMNRLVLCRLVLTGPRFVLDGYPRTTCQATALLNFLRDRLRRIDRAYHVWAPPAEAVRRLLDRGRVDDSRAVIRERLHLYQTRTLPALGLLREAGVPIVDIDSSLPMELVRERVDATLAGLLETAPDGHREVDWDEVLAETFPASDPPAWQGSIGGPSREVLAPARP